MGTIIETGNRYNLDEPFEGEVHDLCREYIAELIEYLVSSDMSYQYEAEPEEIENVSRSGFIPFTEGGWQMCLPQVIGFDIGTGKVPEPIQEIIDANADDVAELWFEDETGQSITTLGEFKERYEKLNAVQHWIEEQGEKAESLRESYWDFEHEYWMESGVYFWKARAIYYDAENSDNVTGEPEVYFDAYLNTDLDYGRDHVSWLTYMGGKADQTHGNFKKVVKVSDIKPGTITSLALEALNHLKSI
ncbi:MAG: hypothetical protein JJ891_06790 [Rhizobiaceae bacterium]|nr:hypothetical protein [Rhizobiaceae bacterium]